jgi:hypothetical protein
VSVTKFGKLCVCRIVNDPVSNEECDRVESRSQRRLMNLMELCSARLSSNRNAIPAFV